MAISDNEAKQLLDQIKYLNEQSITTSILLSSLLELLTKKGTITRDEMQNAIDEYQKLIMEEQQKLLKQAQASKISQEPKIITPDDVSNIRQAFRR